MTIRHPFEGLFEGCAKRGGVCDCGDRPCGMDAEKAQPRPMPCPECGSTRGYTPVGNYRSHCLGCNALLKNKEIDPNFSN